MTKSLQNIQQTLFQISDWEALLPDKKSYFLDGKIIDMSPTSWDHGAIQANLTTTIKTLIRTKKDLDTNQTDDWLIINEASVKYKTNNSGFIHDIAGWKKSRWILPKISHAIDVSPDWVCEILSPSNSSKDFVDVKQVLMLEKVPHYWIVDIKRKCIIVYAIEDNYTIARTFFLQGEKSLVIPPFNYPIDLEEIFNL